MSIDIMASLSCECKMGSSSLNTFIWFASFTDIWLTALPHFAIPSLDTMALVYRLCIVQWLFQKPVWLYPCHHQMLPECRTDSPPSDNTIADCLDPASYLLLDPCWPVYHKWPTLSADPPSSAGWPTYFSAHRSQNFFQSLPPYHKGY